LTFHDTPLSSRVSPGLRASTGFSAGKQPLKKRVYLAKGCGSFATAQAGFIATLFGVAA